MLDKGRSLPGELLCNRQSDHDIHLHRLFAAQKMNLLNHLETEAAVELEIERTAALQVADAVFDISLNIRVSRRNGSKKV